MVGNVIKEFLVALGYKVDKGSENEFLSSLSKTTKAVMILSTAVVAGAGALFGSVLKTADSLNKMNDKAEMLGTTVKNLEEIGYVASLTGSSTEAAYASMERLAKMSGEAAIGVGRGAQAFEKLGVKAKNADGSIKDTSQLMTELGEKVKGLSRQEQIATFERLGIDRTMIKGLTTDVSGLRKEFNAMYDAAGVDANKAAKAAAAFIDEWQRLKSIGGMLWRAINVAFLERFKTGIQQLRKLITDNFDAIKKVMVAIISVITRVAGAIVAAVMRIISWIAALGRWFGGLSDETKKFIAVVGLLIAAWKLLNSAFIKTPLGLVITALVALFLIIDDIMTFLEGGESAIDWTPWVGQIKAVIGWLKTLKEYLVAFWQGLVQGFNAGWAVLKGIFSAIWSVIGTIISAIMKFFGLFIPNLKGGAAIAKALGTAIGSILPFLAALLIGAKVLGAAFLLFKTVINGILAPFKALFGLFKLTVTSAKTIYSVISSLSGVFKTVANAVMTFGRSVVTFLPTAINFFRQVGIVALNFGKNAIAALSGLLPYLKSAASALIRFGAVVGQTFIQGAAAVASFLKSFAMAGWAALKTFGTWLVTTAIPAVWAFTTALLANPITWIIAGIAALAGAIYLLWKYWDDLAEVVSGWWQGLKNVLGSIVGWFAELPSLIGSALASVFGFIIAPFQAAWDWITGAGQAVLDWFFDLPGMIGRAFGSLFDIIVAPFVKAFEFVKGIWNGFMSLFRADKASVETAAKYNKQPGVLPGSAGKSTTAAPLAEYKLGAQTFEKRMEQINNTSISPQTVSNSQTNHDIKNEQNNNFKSEINVTVQGGGIDPNSIARPVGREVDRVNRNSANQIRPFAPPQGA